MQIRCTESVPSVRYQSANTQPSTTAKNTVDTGYGMWNPTCSTSAAIVPNSPIMATANQYAVRT